MEHTKEKEEDKDRNDELERKIGGIGKTEEQRGEEMEESEERERERNRGITVVKGVQRERTGC